MSNDNLDQISIDALQLSMQAAGSLKRSQIHTIEDLMHYTQEDLKVLDPAASEEVIQALETPIEDLMHYTQEDLKVLDPAASEEVIQALETRFGLTLPLNDLQ